jgi:hypothetical protein
MCVCVLCVCVCAFGDKVLQEAQEEADGNAGVSEPLCIFITGAPGVGKSFAIKWAFKLFQRLGHTQGEFYQALALQAVTHTRTIPSSFSYFLMQKKRLVTLPIMTGNLSHLPLPSAT